MSSSLQSTFEVMLILQEYLHKSPQEHVTILDVACGFGQNGSSLMPICHSQKIHPSIVGVDIWLPYLDTLKNNSVYDCLLHCDVKKMPFAEKQFDIIIATEILEHIKKENAALFLDQLETLLKDNSLLVVSTPQGKQEQGEIEGNIYQEHVSVWLKKDLEHFGFNVVTTPLVINTPLGRAFIPIRKIHKGSKTNIKNLLCFSLGGLSFLIPSLSGKLVAYKFKKEKNMSSNS